MTTINEDFINALIEIQRIEGVSWHTIAKRLRWHPKMTRIENRRLTLRSMAEIAFAFGYRIDVQHEDTTILLKLVKIAFNELTNA